MKKDKTKKHNTNLQKLIDSAVQRATKKGSTAKSMRGRLRFLRRLGPDMTHFGFYKWIESHRSMKVVNLAYSNLELGRIRNHHKNRRKDADAKRAANDKQFRKQFSAALREEAEKLVTRKEIRDFSDQVWSERNKIDSHLQNIDRQLEIAKSPVLRTKLNLRNLGVACVNIKVTAAVKAGGTIIRRGKDWKSYVCIEPSHVICKPGWTEWRNGRPISYTRASNDSYVRSVAMIQSSGNSLDYLLHETIYSVAAPTHFHWKIDDYGVKLVDTTGADYHPSGEELILPNAGDHCRDQLLTNSKKRATLTKHDAFGDVRVSMQDSLEAGNCPAGSSRFAQTHGLDAHGYYSPELLLRISRPSEERQVRATIAVAVKNHQRMTDTGAMVFYPPPPMNVAQQIKMENVGCIPMTQ